MNGILNIYKEAGYTSFDVVAKLRGILKIKKIGHTGTLDPDAVGVLPVCVGNATKLVELLTDHDKEYIAKLRLGVATDTQDMSGKILHEADVTCTLEEVESAIESFVGGYAQIPPMYSALKVNGRKLYELAREGIEVERKARDIVIEEIEILSMELPIVTMRVVCSKGTYIRTLCHDIGEKLGCYGAMQHLTRSRVDCFRIEDALTLSEVEAYRDSGELLEHMISPESVFMHLEKLVVPDRFAKFLDNGNTIMNTMFETPHEFEDGTEVRMYVASGKFYGVFKYSEKEDKFKPVRLFF
ncbi:MAG: tRNA pseudouridine(55) synthase TruB [Lachnospiraceae bacterium]